MSDMEVQLQEINSLADRVMLMMGGAGEEVPYFLRAENTYQLGQPSVRKLAFNVPADADFHGERLNVYYQYRIINVEQTTGVLQSDRTFRPCDWSSRADVAFIAEPARQGNVVLRLTDDGNGDYQNEAFSVASVYSSPYGTVGGMQGAALTLYQGGLDFHVPYIIAKGKVAQLTVTPLCSLAAPLTEGVEPIVSGNFRVEFRVVAEFSGYKIVRAFQ